MTTINRVGVFSVAKIFGALYAIFGLIFGAMFTCFSLLGFLAALSSELGGQAIVILFGVGAIIFMPILYGIIGFTAGAIAAFVYNVVAGMIGGIEIELSD